MTRGENLFTPPPDQILQPFICLSIYYMHFHYPASFRSCRVRIVKEFQRFDESSYATHREVECSSSPFLRTRQFFSFGQSFYVAIYVKQGKPRSRVRFIAIGMRTITTGDGAVKDVKGKDFVIFESARIGLQTLFQDC